MTGLDVGHTAELDALRGERIRIAALIEEHAATIADFAADKERAVLLTALCIRLGDL